MYKRDTIEQKNDLRIENKNAKKTYRICLLSFYMIAGKKQFRTIDEYIKTFPEDIQSILKKMRQAIAEAAPEASETISYQMPTFTLNGNLVHFAAYKNHIGFYPTPSGIEAFKKELSHYKGAKGSVQFPIDKPVPYDLVKKIVLFRVEENQKKRR
jgi:uncharacterized protein YdhG (YjbR/CyaY superfamily)